MISNTAIDVVIGLVFIFLLYSLLATILQEIMAQIFDLRARMLVKTIRVMLDDRKETNGNWFVRVANHIWSNMTHWFCPLENNTLSKIFYSHPTIKYLAQSSWKSKPSYIGPRNFSTTVIQLLRGKCYDGSEPQMNAIYRTLFEDEGHISYDTANVLSTSIDPETLNTFKQLYIDSQRDIERFKGMLEKSFDETMERAGGWYKKQTQNILFFIGLVIAIVFNADAIALSTLLSNDKTARENMVELTIAAAPKYEGLVQQLQARNSSDTSFQTNRTSAGATDTTTVIIKDTIFIAVTDEELKEAYKIVRSDMDKAGNILGLGWADNDSCKVCDSLQLQLADITKNSVKTAQLNKQLNYYNAKFNCKGNPYQKGGVTTAFGWLLTALAISLGAPFWFDLLNKVIQLRSFWY